MAELMKGGDVASTVKKLVSLENQVKEYSIDLTVNEVYALAGPGKIDFSGREYEEPRRVKLEPKKSPEDEYGWWELRPGKYLVTLNEVVEKVDGIGFISPHPRLLKVGCTHATLFTLEWGSEYVIPLTVGGNGLELKENSRISKLLVLKL
ncbi:MAG: dCTP deaminase [Candidatus Altiarchaeota archaeon]